MLRKKKLRHLKVALQQCVLPQVNLLFLRNAEYFRSGRSLHFLFLCVWRFLQFICPHIQKMGIEVSFVDQDLPLEELKKAIRPNTKAVFAETIANPALRVLDIENLLP